MPGFTAQSTPTTAALVSINAGASPADLVIQPPDGIVHFLQRFSWSGRMLPHVFTLQSFGHPDLAAFGPSLITEDWQALGLPDFRDQVVMATNKQPLVFRFTNVDIVARNLEYTYWIISANEDRAEAIRAARRA